MPRGRQPGVRLSLMAIEPYGSSSFVIARMRIPRKQGHAPVTVTEVFEMWWEYANLKTSLTHSDLTRSLAVSSSHVEKVLARARQYKVNVLVYPGKLVSSPAGDFVDELVRAYAAASKERSDPLWKFQRWGEDDELVGSRALGLGAQPMGLFKGWAWPSPYETRWIPINDLSGRAKHPDYMVYARLAQWVNKNCDKWGMRLQAWAESKDQYMNEQWRKPRITREAQAGIAKMIEAGADPEEIEAEVSKYRRITTLKRDGDGNLEQGRMLPAKHGKYPRNVKKRTRRQDKA